MTFDKIPLELRNSSRWLLWRLQDGERQRTKVPYCAHNPSQPGSSTDGTTWSKFDDAIEALKKFRPADKYENEAWAKAILEQLPRTYTELSPSKKGFHLWYRCADSTKLPDGHRTERAEVYSSKRYFTMTGQHCVDFPATITELSLAD